MESRDYKVVLQAESNVENGDRIGVPRVMLRSEWSVENAKWNVACKVGRVVESVKEREVEGVGGCVENGECRVHAVEGEEESGIQSGVWRGRWGVEREGGGWRVTCGIQW